MSEKELSDSIEYYERLVESKLKMLEDEEIDLLLTERDAIHDLIGTLPVDEQEEFAKKIRALDNLLLSQIDTIDISRFGYPEYADELWWWHLDRLDDLTTEQKSTI